MATNIGGLFFELFVKDDKLKSSLEKAQREVKSAVGRISNAAKTLDDAFDVGDATDKLTRDIKAAEKNVTRAANHIGHALDLGDETKGIAKDIGKAAAAIEGGTEKIEGSLGEASAAFKKLGRDAKKASGTVAGAGAQLGGVKPLPGGGKGPAKGIAKIDFNKLKQSAASAFTTITQHARTAALALTAITAAVTILGTKFEKDITKVAVLADGSTKNLGKLKDAAREMGATTVFSASEAATAMTALAQAGLSVDEIIGGANSSLALAAASGSELAAVTKITAASMKQFGIDASQAGHISDVFTTALNKSMLTMDSLSVAMSFAGPIGAAFGHTLEETTAAVAMFADLGLRGSKAGTAFRMSMSQAANVTKAGAEVLEKYGLTAQDINPTLHSFGDILQVISDKAISTNDAIKVFGSEAGGAVVALAKRNANAASGTVESFEAMKLAMVDSFGVAEVTAEQMLDNVHGSFEITKSAITELILSVFDTYAAPLTKFLGRLADVIGYISAEFNRASNSIDKGFAATLDGLGDWIEANKMKLANLFISTVNAVEKLSALMAAIIPHLGNIARVMAVAFGVTVVHKLTMAIIAAKAALLNFIATMSAAQVQMATVAASVGIFVTAVAGLALVLGSVADAYLTAERGASAFTTALEKMRKESATQRAEQLKATGAALEATKANIMSKMIAIKAEGQMTAARKKQIDALKWELDSLNDLSIAEGEAAREAGRAILIGDQYVKTGQAVADAANGQTEKLDALRKEHEAVSEALEESKEKSDKAAKGAQVLTNELTGLTGVLAHATPGFDAHEVLADAVEGSNRLSATTAKLTKQEANLKKALDAANAELELHRNGLSNTDEQVAKNAKATEAYKERLESFRKAIESINKIEFKAKRDTDLLGKDEGETRKIKFEQQVEDLEKLRDEALKHAGRNKKRQLQAEAEFQAALEQMTARFIAKNQVAQDAADKKLADEKQTRLDAVIQMERGQMKESHRLSQELADKLKATTADETETRARLNEVYQAKIKAAVANEAQTREQQLAALKSLETEYADDAFKLRMDLAKKLVEMTELTEEERQRLIAAYEKKITLATMRGGEERISILTALADRVASEVTTATAGGLKRDLANRQIWSEKVRKLEAEKAKFIIEFAHLPEKEMSNAMNMFNALIADAHKKATKGINRALKESEKAYDKNGDGTLMWAERVSMAFSRVGKGAVTAGRVIATSFKGLGTVFLGIGKGLGAATKAVAAFGDFFKTTMEGLTGFSFNISDAIGSVLGSMEELTGMSGGDLAGMDPKAAKKAAAGAAEEFVTGLIGKASSFVMAMANALPVLLQELTAQLPGLLGQVAQQIGPILTALAEGLPDVITAIVDALPIIVQALADNIGPIITALVNGAMQVVQAVADNIGPIVNALVGAAVQLVTGIVDMLPIIVNEIIGKLPEIIDTLLLGLIDIVQMIADNIGPIITALIGSLTDVIEAIVERLDPLMAALMKGIQEIVTAIADNLGPIVEALLKGVIKIVTYVLDALPGIITELLAAVPDLITKLLDGAVQLVVVILKAVPDIVNALLAGIPDIITALVVGLANAIPVIIMAVLDAIPGIVLSLVENIPKILEAILGAIPVLIQSVIGMIPGVLMAVVDMIPIILPALIDLLIQTVSTLLTMIPQIVLSLLDAIFVDLIPMLPGIAISLVAAIYQAIGQILGKFGGLITQMFAAVFAWFKELPAKAVEFVKTGIDFLFTKLPVLIKEFIAGIPEGLKKIADDIAQFFAGIFESLFGWVTDLFDENKNKEKRKDLDGSGKVSVGEWFEATFGKKSGGAAYAGLDYVPATMRMTVHKGEAIVPADRNPFFGKGADQAAPGSLPGMAQGFRGTSGGGNVAVEVHIDGAVVDGAIVRANENGTATGVGKMIRKSTGTKVGLSKGRYNRYTK